MDVRFCATVGILAACIALILSGATAAIRPDADTILYVSGDVDCGFRYTATASGKFERNCPKNDRLVTEEPVGARVRSGLAGATWATADS